MRAPCLAFLACAAILAACGNTEPAVVVHPADAPPERLRDWGVVYAARGELRFNEAARVYTLNTPLFSDYALKLRTIWMPPGESAEYRAEGPFLFPVGTILSKTFYYPAAPPSGDGILAVGKVTAREELPHGLLELDAYRLIETRLLVRYADGWRAFPYVWNAAQSEAVLSVAGDLQALRFESGVAFTYVVPDTNQCAGCHVTDHASKALRPLGPKAWQLNRNIAGAAPANQLDRWVADGLLAGAPATYPEGIDWSRPAAGIHDRATAYLDANCAHCHNDRGPADTSALDLRLGVLPGRATGICKPPVAVGRGSGDRPYDIWPGRPGESILLYRMQHTDPAIAMPELGRSTVHAEAVGLLSDWIEALPGDC